MPIKIMVNDRGATPIVVCDFCGAWIDKAEDGSYEWDDNDPRTVSLQEVFFLHNEDCVLAFERQHGKALYSMPLDVLIPYLATNLGVDWAAAYKRAKYFSTP